LLLLLLLLLLLFLFSVAKNTPAVRLSSYIEFTSRRQLQRSSSASQPGVQEQVHTFIASTCSVVYQ
jgi:hypothetical protein